MDGQGVTRVGSAVDRPALENAGQLVVACHGVCIPTLSLWLSYQWVATQD